MLAFMNIAWSFKMYYTCRASRARNVKYKISIPQPISAQSRTPFLAKMKCHRSYFLLTLLTLRGNEHYDDEPDITHAIKRRRTASMAHQPHPPRRPLQQQQTSDHARCNRVYRTRIHDDDVVWAAYRAQHWHVDVCFRWRSWWHGWST